MVHERLRFALEQLSSGDWLLFERFCSEFLSPEFPTLRTTASASGDRGRDGELFAVDGIPSTGFQFSVTENWQSKITSTLSTLAKNGLDYRRLVYCTSRQIGAKGDHLKSEIWTNQQIQLDIRDRDWFCERELSSPEREVAAAELAARVVDPIVTARGIASTVGAPLSTTEGRVALVQLALNARDRSGDRNLTRTSFDALVRAALIDTSQENTLSEHEVIEHVLQIVPHGAENQVAALTRSALGRLSRKHGPVKYRSDTARYHLSFEASQEWKTEAAGYLLNQEALDEDLTAGAYGYDPRLDGDFESLKAEGRRLRVALEHVMMESGEAFVAAVEGSDPRHLSQLEITEAIARIDVGLTLRAEDAASAILEVIAMPSDGTRRHLLRVLDAYTLLAFLQQTPDVQKAMSRVFDNAKIWLDTSAILPLVAETLIDQQSDRQQTSLLAAAVSSGVTLYVTDGVLEELRFHLERCVAYVKNWARWEGDPPYMYSAYMLSGRDERRFTEWLATIRGDIDPERDIAEYLEHHFAVERNDLADLAEQAPADLRGAVQELFREKHHSRRRGKRTENVMDRLAAHDVESVVGVIQLRKGSRPALGHEVWWLTLDKTGLMLRSWLRDQLGRDAPDSPVLSPDYLSQLLRLGPLRRVAGGDPEKLPLIVDVSRLERIPRELIEEARRTRQEFDGYDELRIRREVRDSLTRLRTTMRSRHDYGREVRGGVETGLRSNKGSAGNGRP